MKLYISRTKSSKFKLKVHKFAKINIWGYQHRNQKIVHYMLGGDLTARPETQR